MPVFEPQIKNIVNARPSSKSNFINKVGSSPMDKLKVQMGKSFDDSTANQFQDKENKDLKDTSQFLQIHSLIKNNIKENKPKYSVNRSFTTMGRPIQTSSKIKIRKEFLENDLIPIEYYWNDRMNHFKLALILTKFSSHWSYIITQNE